jgi:hypothetical protein
MRSFTNDIIERYNKNNKGKTLLGYLHLLN